MTMQLILEIMGTIIIVAGTVDAAAYDVGRPMPANDTKIAGPADDARGSMRPAMSPRSMMCAPLSCPPS